MHPQDDTRSSLSKSRIEKKTKNEIIDTNIATNESLRFLSIFWQINPIISSSNELSKLPFRIHQVLT